MHPWLRKSFRVTVLAGLICLIAAGTATVRLAHVEAAHAAMAPLSRLSAPGSHRPGRSLAARSGQNPPPGEAGKPASVPRTDPNPEPVWTYADVTAPDPVPRIAPSAGADHPAARGEQIPVLMYHEIGDVDNSLYVSRRDFEAEVKWLSENGFHTVTLGEVYRHLHEGQPLPAKPIVLTFDDGYQTFADVVVPVLKPYGFRATAFIITGTVGRRGYMTWEQVKELPAAGMEIGSHTVNHLDLRTLPPARLRQELEESKRELEEQTGVKIEFFCYPAGRYNEAVVAAVKSAGYLAAVTTEYGPVTPEEPAQLWSRIRISRGDTLKAFASKVNQASGLK